MNKKLNEEFNVLSNEEISQCTDLQNALELINKENIITEIEPIELKKFSVAKKEEAKELASLPFEERSEKELDEISDQANSAFLDLMDIAVNSTGKGCADIASAANSFLNIKLSTKVAKIDAKMKRLNYELAKQKFESLNKPTSSDDEDDDDGIVIIDEH
jgi:hypothetical protein